MVSLRKRCNSSPTGDELVPRRAPSNNLEFSKGRVGKDGVACGYCRHSAARSRAQESCARPPDRIDDPEPYDPESAR